MVQTKEELDGICMLKTENDFNSWCDGTCCFFVLRVKKFNVFLVKSQGDLKYFFRICHRCIQFRPSVVFNFRCSSSPYVFDPQALRCLTAHPTSPTRRPYSCFGTASGCSVTSAPSSTACSAKLKSSRRKVLRPYPCTHITTLYILGCDGL